MLKRLLKGSSAAAVLIACVALLSTKAYAAGSVSISADLESAVVGDTVNISYQAENPEGADEAPQISVTYDPNRLSFLDCDKEYGGGGGGLITFSDLEASMSFSVLSGGTASVWVEAILNGDGAEVPTASVDIYVDGEDTAANASSTPESDTGVEAGTIMYTDGTKVISTVFASEYMPALFHKSTTQYEGQDVEVAVFDMDDSIKLLYVTDTAGQNGSFNIYDAETNSLSDFRMIQGIENRFIIILPTTDDTPAPDRFTRVTLQWNNQTIGAYMFSGDSDDEDEDEDEGGSVIDNAGVSSDKFFLLYAVSSEGNKGWYMYDQEEGTYLRYPHFIASAKSGESEGFFAALTGSSDDEDEEGFFTASNIKLIIIITLAVIVIVMIVVMINMGLKLRDYQSYDYIDEEEEEMEEEEEEGPKPKKASAKSIAVSQMDDDIEIEDINGGGEADEDDEDEEEDDKYDKKRMKAEAKERKRQEKLEKKKRKRGYAEPEAMDWSSFEKDMKDEEEDDRRPMGNDVDKLPPQYRNAAMQNAEQPEKNAEPVKKPVRQEAEKVQPQMKKAAPVKEISIEDEEEIQIKKPSMKQQAPAKTIEQAKIERAQMEQLQREQAMREQAMKEQILREQAKREQLQREQMQREAMEREQYYNNYNPYAQGNINPNMNPNMYPGMMGNQYNNQNEDLDEDFEFEFLDLGE